MDFAASLILINASAAEMGRERRGCQKGRTAGQRSDKKQDSGTVLIKVSCRCSYLIIASVRIIF